MDLVLQELIKNLTSPLSSLLLQILVILAAARICGRLVGYFGQPQVIGEILAGICLGPSLLQSLAPVTHAFVFPEGSVPRLFFLSQIGIVLFMFIVGLELDMKMFRSKARSAIVISTASIVLPFALGIGLAIPLFQEYGSVQKGEHAFVLFMGIAMSITAFPVLARIIQEQGLARTQIGTLAITCAAANDVTAWCLLALVVGLVQSGSGMGAIATIVLTIVFTLFMFLVARPFLRDRLGPHLCAEQFSATSLSIVFMGLLLSAWITEMIGIHALFGAFLMGLTLPEHDQFKEKLIARIQDITTIVLLPLFFALTGLRTQLGALDDLQSWGICALVLLVATVGKFGGAALAARFTGHGWRTSCILGALMNTRGLVELIVLNLGYDLGILSPKMFTIMVIMAIATTMMAGPIVRALKPDPT
ncbi:MAG TPA: cation:proton antiporter [Burkholderiales bacterium]|nr:cation:proton antiporter [Burkholderiales bacterium]